MPEIGRHPDHYGCHRGDGAVLRLVEGLALADGLEQAVVLDLAGVPSSSGSRWVQPPGASIRPGCETRPANARRGIEKVFGWIKQAAGLRQCKHRGRSTVGGVFLLHVITYDVVRLGNILKANVVDRNNLQQSI